MESTHLANTKEVTDNFPFITDAVTSADGTTIGYRQTGVGPGLVILHSGGRASHHYVRLARGQADSFCVTNPVRRGRELSGPAGADYHKTDEIEDVSAILKAVGANYLFGHSAGGVFDLDAALELLVEELILFEPGDFLSRTSPELDQQPPVLDSISDDVGNAEG